MGSPQNPHHQARQRRVLIVDDHADTRDLLERLLSRRYEVVTAGCFDSALALAAVRAPDIVVTDVGLPGRDGIALMRELRDRYGAAGIAVTGHAIDSAATLREAGFIDWMRKPIEFNALLTALAALHAEPAKTACPKTASPAGASASRCLARSGT